MKSATKPRIAPLKSAVVIVDGTPDTRRLRASLLDCQGRELCVLLDQEVAASSAVRVHLDGGLVIGTAIACRRAGAAQELVIQIEKVVPQSDLSCLVSAVMGESKPVLMYEPPPATPAEAPVPVPVPVRVKAGLHRAQAR
jgi:hypothetical protein